MSGTANNVKVLLAGDVNGKIDALYKRIATVNASNGPFNALFCVGSFFNPDGAFIAFIFHQSRSTPLIHFFSLSFQALTMLISWENSRPM